MELGELEFLVDYGVWINISENFILHITPGDIFEPFLFFSGKYGVYSLILLDLTHYRTNGNEVNILEGKGVQKY